MRGDKMAQDSTGRRTGIIVAQDSAGQVETRLDPRSARPQIIERQKPSPRTERKEAA
ncbi:MAG TPA: hypothetical protein VHW09_31815 [Bryobacteraceae bacterium]|nr:hypothetical protein [Bryobacteraceae bacterium]